MKKTELKTKLISFVSIAVILGSIFAGVVSAESYLKFNKCSADSPISINETAHSERMTPLSSRLYSPSQAGETVVVTSGDNLDKYLFWPDTIEPTIPVQTNDLDVYSAELTLSIYDVDEYCGGACNGICEVDTVYFNGHYLGTLTGADDQWSTTTFILDPSWVNGEVDGSPGINHVKIIIDTASQECWAVECDWVQLILNAGAQGNAKIVSLSTDKQAYSPSDTINVAIDLTTNIDSQSVRLETNLYDPDGVNIDGSSATYTLHKNTITSINRQLSIPVNSPSGEYTVEAIVYDSASVQQDKKTVIVTVGADPDFYVTAQDIEFSQIKTVPGGLEVSVDASIHYENDNAPRDVDVKFYDEDINTGSKTLVTSKTVSMSPGVNTVSILWEPSSYQHRLCVVIDPDDKIEETNENNNEACKPLEGPTIDDVKPKYKGYFLSGISVNNVYYVFTSGNVDYVEFDMTGDVKTDSYGLDGWSMAYDMGDLPPSSKLTVTAFSDVGIPSEPVVITPQIINTPVWISTMVTFGLPVHIWSLTHLAHDNIYAVALEKGFTGPVALVDVPKWIPVVGGKHGLKTTESKIKVKVQSDGVTEVLGKAGTAVYIASDTPSNPKGTLGGLVKGSLDILNNLKIKALSLGIFGDIMIPGPSYPLSIEVFGKTIGLKIGVNFIPGVNILVNFEEDPTGGIFLGLGWEDISGSLKTAVVGYGSGGVGLIDAEAKIGGEPRLSLKVPPPYFKQFALIIFAKAKATFLGWQCPEFTVFEYEWAHPPKAGMQNMHTIQTTSGEWKPIPRGYVTPDYAKFTGSKSNLKMLGLSTFALNALGAQESSIIENVFPYASPSIATDNSGNAIMIWSHDDINKPQIQGFEIYYSTWDGNSWSSPGPVTDNYLPEFKPSVMFDLNGNAIAVWTLFNNASITNETYVFSVLDDVELAYSVWDKNTKTWSTPEVLTNNSMFEGLVSLSNDINGNVAATWIVDKDNNITTILDRDIYYSIWNGSGWGDLEVVTNDVAVDVNPTLAYSQNNAISVWSQDTDGNITTRTDRELYYAVWDGSEWSTPTYLTNDNIEDTIPTIMFDKFNKVTLTWIKRNETADRVCISTYDNGWSSPELVAESPTIYEMELSFDSENNAVIVWQGASSSGQDIFYTVRDNSNQLWCGEKQLTNDTSAEWQLSTTINSKDEIMSCYVKHNISIVNYTVIEGESDLCYLIHPIMLDLTLDSTDITFSDETAYPGDTITIDATIHNIGDLQANSVEVKFFDGSTGPQIGITQTIPSLPAGQNATVSVTWNIPSLQQSHNIYVKVDPEDKLPETNESNNVAFASIVLPDLEIDESDVIFSYEHGSLRINATIHNSGVITASNVPVELFDEGSNGTLIDATTIAFLHPNSNETISTIWNTQGVSSGIHNISIIVDRMDGIREQNETNNIANLTLMILPDLTVNANNVSFSEMSEGNITIDARIRNIGISNAENITIGFFDGDPSENGTLIDSAIIDSISADSESITEIVWYATPGQHDIYVQIDPSNSIQELDKSNNLAFNPVIITPGADLMLNSPDIIFSNVNETGQVSISAMIHNRGFADVPYTTVEFYNGTPDVSVTNPYVTNIPNSLGTEVVPLVSSKGYVMVNLSANWTPMENTTYNIYVKIDPKDNIHEFNESNNMGFNRYPPLLVTNLPNVELVYSDPTVTNINVSSLNLYEIDETYKPAEFVTPQSACMINSTGAGNFTLRFTDISGADSILVYKIDPSSTPPDQWVLLDAITTADTVTFTMEVGDPPVVFCSCAPPTAASSSITGAHIDRFRVDADVYATGSGFTPGTNVNIHVVPDQDWNDGDQIPQDITGTVETVSVNGGNIAPVLVWPAPLVVGEYDIVIDANRNGVYDAHVDGLDSGSPGFVVIDMPSVPVPALAPIGIIALIGLLCVAGMGRIRRRFN